MDGVQCLQKENLLVYIKKTCGRFTEIFPSKKSKICCNCCCGMIWKMKWSLMRQWLEIAVDVGEYNFVLFKKNCSCLQWKNLLSIANEFLWNKLWVHETRKKEKKIYITLGAKMQW